VHTGVGKPSDDALDVTHPFKRLRQLVDAVFLLHRLWCWLADTVGLDCLADDASHILELLVVIRGTGLLEGTMHQRHQQSLLPELGGDKRGYDIGCAP